MIEFYNGFEEETEDFVGVEHVRDYEFGAYLYNINYNNSLLHSSFLLMPRAEESTTSER